MKPVYDDLILELFSYVENYQVPKKTVNESAYYCVLDAIGCAALALDFKTCRDFLGPIAPAIALNQGCRAFGVQTYLSPMDAAFNMTAMIRWLDFNDTWLGAEWGHPSDCLGALLAVAEYANLFLGTAYSMADIAAFLVKSYEIQGILAQENAFNRVGIDHVAFLKIASTALCSKILKLDETASLAALSNAFIDGQALRTYRHYPNAGSRKSWAAADAVAKAVQLAFLAQKGMMGIPSALTAAKWGLYDVYFSGKPFSLARPLADFVVNHILFKVPFAAEYHSVTAIESACMLKERLEQPLENIAAITIETQAAGKRIIDKQGPLNNPADRDHCLQYIVAIALIYGEVYPHHFEQDIAQNPAIDLLRSKMTVLENPAFTEDYLDINIRSCANKITLELKDATIIGPVQVDFPLGHANRRAEAIPYLIEKYQQNIKNVKRQKQFQVLLDRDAFYQLKVQEWLGL